ncbi:DNA methyltransferase [Sphingobacterium lactis]|uniref:site-specific DNA-methyltransferase (adenine-specific) n=1 Tax=Sphingobacterium lactis TaxID=797291 RepID=A0A1H5UEN7_9SPHI|nr:site-specific DNA-methyltransferase [Sphingobacterium lactis]SEF73486.1 adenine-specific DNA-methyltransferase [Sphingobacterium lactis]
MKLYTTLEQQLKKEPNFVTDSGELKKWVVLNKAQNFDEELIGLLLDDDELKEKFFLDLKGALVFKQNFFMQFLEQKNYLNESYTVYKNKVGLSIDGRYLKQRNEVSLVWPFKDCILEGGQSREEDKREEIFFNEILAQDEITQLLEPKVLTNCKYIDKNGVKRFDGFSRNENAIITDNLLIKGNNLLALHSLKEEFKGKVKLIYIDPPYNTGNDSFQYNDTFNHSTWLTFMKNRLEVAYELLSTDGSIFISIDEGELGYLQILLNEVFGEENQVNLITIKRGSVTGHKAINPGVVNITEYVIVFCKNRASWKPNRVHQKRERNERYNTFILNRDQEISAWKFCSLLDAFSDYKEIPKTKLKRQLGNTFEKEIYDFVKKNADAVVQIAYPDADKVSKEVQELIKESKKSPKQVFHHQRVYESDIYLINGQRLLFYSDRLMEIDGELVTGEPLGDYWGDVLPNDLHNEGGVKLKKGKKPEKLIKRILEIGSNENDVVLDFHLGSGTTSAVALKMNRQFIGIEQLDYGENDSFNRLVNTINGEKSGISKAVNWKGGGSFVYFELKKYNETFIEQIQAAEDSETLLKIWEQMKSKSFLNYNVDIKKSDQHLDEFKSLTFIDQQSHLCELLDKNQLYVNISSLSDSEFSCTEEDKKVTVDFYQLNK